MKDLPAIWIPVLVALLTSGGTGVLVNHVFTRGTRKAEKTQVDHETWFREAEKSYDRAISECQDCKTRLIAADLRYEEADRRHDEEMASVRTQLADLKDAVVTRADVVDELLPYVQGLPEDKLLELRAANRAVKLAVFRSR